MAIGPTLPPQAYTREILTAAFNWLQSQPESVRKLATTPDALVGLYMRAQRYGHSTLESDAPVSSQNFMSDLKSLAEGLKQFEAPPVSVSTGYTPGGAGGYGAQASQSSSHHSNYSQHHVPPRQAEPPSQSTHQSTHQAAPQAPSQQMTPSMAAQLTSQMQAQIPHQTPSNLPNAAMLRAQIQNSHGVPQLNEMSQRMIQEVKTHLNLSSETETINMMLALAYKNLKNLIG